MGKEDRKEDVLEVLSDSGLALTPYVIFRNARMRGATWERRSTTNYLNELLDEGRVEKITFDEGNPLYRITDKGEESFQKSGE